MEGNNNGTWKFLHDEVKEIRDGYWLREHHGINRGPCGLAQNVFGLSPFEVGVEFAQHKICNSEPSSCKKCPLNPDRKDSVNDLL